MRQVLKSIIKKEFIHIWRDPQTLLIIFIFPLLMLFLFGYAITLEMRQITAIVSDLSRTPQSRRLIDKIGASGFFKLQQQYIKENEIDAVFQARKARCIIVIPGNFTQDLEKKHAVDIQVLIDASDPNAANYINNYLTTVIYKYNQQLNGMLPVSFSVEPRFLYNPELKSANFFVPGLIAIILILISALLTSVAIAREKENGTMEQILVSPVRVLDIIIGKVLPYLMIAFLSGVLILFSGIYFFKVPLYGSWLALLFGILIYTFTGLSFGLMISTVAKSQQVAMLMTLMSTVLPTIMLSGFIFPVESMPIIFRVISNIIPARHFIIIIRSIMLKGLPLSDLGHPLLFLIGLSLMLIIVSTKKFKNGLE